MKKLPLISMLVVGFFIAYYQPNQTIIKTKNRKSSFSEINFITPQTVHATQLASNNSASCSIQEPAESSLSSSPQSPENVTA